MEFYFNAFYISDSTYKSLRFSYQKRKRIKDRPREFCDATNKKKQKDRDKLLRPKGRHEHCRTEISI